MSWRSLLETAITLSEKKMQKNTKKPTEKYKWQHRNIFLDGVPVSTKKSQKARSSEKSKFPVVLCTQAHRKPVSFRFILFSCKPILIGKRINTERK